MRRLCRSVYTELGLFRALCFLVFISFFCKRKFADFQPILYCYNISSKCQWTMFTLCVIPEVYLSAKVCWIIQMRYLTDFWQLQGFSCELQFLHLHFCTRTHGQSDQHWLQTLHIGSLYLLPKMLWIFYWKWLSQQTLTL